MKFEWRVPAEEKLINKIQKSEDVNPEEIGTFDLLTDKPLPLKEKTGSLLIYFQGIDIKHGREDRIGNSPLSWVEETLFPGTDEATNKSYRLPIEHTAKKLGFDHFITFNFPYNLTSRGFRISMKNLLNYLLSKNFVVAIASFSNGATLLTEWILDSIKNELFEDLNLLINKSEVIICAGSLCESKDLEPNAYRIGKLVTKSYIEPFANIPLLSRHHFIRRGGGVKELINRVKYLYTLDNIEKAKSLKHDVWEKSKDIFQKKLHFKLILLADMGQRVVLPSGAIKWYQILKPHFQNQVLGFVAQNISNPWIKYPAAKHSEVKHLWTLVALLGISINLRKSLNFSPMANEIADEWPKRRFKLMSDFVPFPNHEPAVKR